MAAKPPRAATPRKGDRSGAKAACAGNSGGMPQTGQDRSSETSLDPQALHMPFSGPVTLPQRERKSRIIPSLRFPAGSIVTIRLDAIPV